LYAPPAVEDHAAVLPLSQAKLPVENWIAARASTRAKTARIIVEIPNEIRGEEFNFRVEKINDIMQVICGFGLSPL
jgi:hypothetical protein